jgi:N-acetylneuraminic acid mutarotase
MNLGAAFVLAGGVLCGSPLSAQVQGQWTLTGAMQSPRVSEGQALLANGNVLTAGGVDNNSNILASAEIWSHTKNVWALTTSMQTAREIFPAVTLRNGKVLVAGGLGTGSTVLSAAELFDPKTNTWSAAGSLMIARYAHTATLLANGRVLVAGGCTAANCGVVTATSEIYNPSTNHWLTTGNLNTARAYHAAVLLNSGKVLVVGAGGTTTELYDPSAGTWSYAASTNVVHSPGATTILGDGKVLMSGGANGRYPVNSAELYDPGSNTWSFTGNMKAGRYGHSATLLADGTAIVAGGYSQAISCGKDCVGYIPTASAEIYDESTGTFKATASLTRALAYQATTVLANGRALVNGGIGYNAYCCQVVADTEFYTPLTLTFSSSSLNFGYLKLGLTSPPQAVTVTNVTSHSVAFSNIASNGDYAETNTCTPSLGAGHNCSITITFKPAAAGTRNGAIKLNDDAPGSPTQTIALTGVGETLALGFDPGSLSFGTVTVGSYNTMSATLINDGSRSVNIKGIGISPATKIYTQTNTCPATLNVQQTCTFQITFRPPDIFTYRATLSVTNNAGTAATLKLTGTGQDGGASARLH